MEKRPLPDSNRQWLLDELNLWRRLGLVNEDQVNGIVDLYETPTQSAERRQSTAIYLLVGVSACFVGLAVLLLVAYNWTLLPDAIKLFLLLIAVGGAHALGYSLRYLWDAKNFSESAFFLGCLFYGGSIWLIAGIFHLGSHYPDGIWWWAVGVVPLAFFLDTIFLHMLAVTLLAAWVGTELIGFHGGVPGAFGLPRACWTLPILAGLGFFWSYQKKSTSTLGLYVPLAAWWLALVPLAWSGLARENPILYIGGIGALLLILAEVHPEGSLFAVPYRLYGSLVCIGVLTTLSFFEVQREFRHIHDLGVFVGLSVGITALALGAFGVAAAMHTPADDEATLDRPLMVFVTRQWLPLAMAGLMLFMALWYAALKNAAGNNDAFVAAVPTVLANVGMIGLAFWLMMLGLREDRGFPSGGGVLFFLVWSVCRYTEWFSDHGGLLGGACMFFLCGAAIFGFAMFWHYRKKQRETSDGE